MEEMTANDKTGIHAEMADTAEQVDDARTERQESDGLLDEGEFQGWGLVRGWFLNMIDYDDFNRTFLRLQLRKSWGLHPSCFRLR